MLNREIVSAAIWLHDEVSRMARYNPRWSREDLFRQAIRRGKHTARSAELALDELIVAQVLVTDPHRPLWLMPGPGLDGWRPTVWELDQAIPQSQQQTEDVAVTKSLRSSAGQ